MSRTRRGGLQAVALGLAFVFTTAMPGGIAEATPGDLLATVTIPDAANCGTALTPNFGSAVAVVPGGKLGFPAIPTLLVTNCVSSVFVGDATTVVSTLYFLDPSTNPATLKGSVSTTAPLQWDALAFRADKADLIGCFDAGGIKGTAIYVIHFSPYDTVAAPGNTGILSSGPLGSTCDGIAWDPNDKTVYQTSTNFDSTSGSFNVLHYSPSNPGAATSIPSGCGNFFIGGVGIAGVSLFVGCSNQAPAVITHADTVVADIDTLPAVVSTGPSIRQLDKATGNLVVRTLMNASIPGFPGGLPDDPSTFGSAFKDAIWTKETASGASGNQLLAFEIPGGTLGQTAGPPLAFPAACDQVNGSTPDADGDGLLDCWEDGSFWSDHLPGISLDGTYSANRDPSFRAVTLCVDQNGNGSVSDPGECASPTHKDIFVEIDYMQYHNPDPTAVTNLINAFANAPANAPFPNPDGTPGIRLHLQIDEQLTHVTNTALVPCTPAPGPGDANFDTIKAASFGTSTERADVRKLNAKRNAFHYMVIAHNQTGSSASGCAEIGGNDILVTLGGFLGNTGPKAHSGGVGTTDQQGGTFMHEIGHNLGLRHGGLDNINCKPNYPSVMSYSRQFSTPLNPRPLDYSRQVVGVPIITPSGPAIGLDETNLTESAGVGAFTGSIIFGPPVSVPFQGTKPKVVSVSGGPVDWNNSGAIDPGTLPSPGRDLNNTGIAGCPASLTPGEQLIGFNDWANLQLNFRASMDFADGAHATIDASKAVDAANSTNAPPGSLEITPEEAIVMGYDTDRDGVPDILDNCPLTPNGPCVVQADGTCVPPGAGSGNQLDADGDGVGDACEVTLLVLRPVVPSTSQGVVQIAILTTPIRDATMIDPSTVVIAGSAASGPGIWSLHVVQNAVGTAQCNKRDVNGDGRTDLVCQFKVDARQLPIGVSNIVLDAMTFGGEAVRGLGTLDVKAVGNGQ